ncbi:hypothetical protein [uncultured Microbulbifer sp.]|uniref:hypothetical protein n=1 Tax=uncultured Microbulbifer sp. TaxID=348147 RepID=UPI002601CFBD|nr:hypothetical protein [uncultured Microbulbifer sp.]
MVEEKTAVKEIEQFIDYLVQAGVHCRVAQLESIYHRDMQAFILDDSDQLTIADKSAFIDLFKAKRDSGELPLNAWKKIHHVEVKNNSALVIFSRINNLSGQERKLRLGIDLIHENGNWQVIREIIFLDPNSTTPTPTPTLQS